MDKLDFFSASKTPPSSPTPSRRETSEGAFFKLPAASKAASLKAEAKSVARPGKKESVGPLKEEVRRLAEKSSQVSDGYAEPKKNLIAQDVPVAQTVNKELVTEKDDLGSLEEAPDSQLFVDPAALALFQELQLLQTPVRPEAAYEPSPSLYVGSQETARIGETPPAAVTAPLSPGFEKQANASLETPTSQSLSQETLPLENADPFSGDSKPDSLDAGTIFPRPLSAPPALSIEPSSALPPVYQKLADIPTPEISLKAMEGAVPMNLQALPKEISDLIQVLKEDDPLSDPILPPLPKDDDLGAVPILPLMKTPLVSPFASLASKAAPALKEFPLALKATEQIQWALRNQKNEVRIRLEPQSLGKLTIKIASENGVMHASFFAENDKAKAMIENQLVELRQALEEQGVMVKSLSVSVGQGQEEHKRHQNLLAASSFSRLQASQAQRIEAEDFTAPINPYLTDDIFNDRF